MGNKKNVMTSNWYVLYTAPRAEKMVEKRLQSNGITTYLPLHKSKRKWSDRVKVLNVPLFNSYIFVYCSEYELRGTILIPGVVRIIYYLEKPAIIRENEISAIKNFLKISEGNRIIIEGDEVEIICGPMKKIYGEVIQISERYSVLYIEELRAKVCVETINLEKVKEQ